MKYSDLAMNDFFTKVFEREDDEFEEYGLNYDALMRDNGIRADIFRDGEQIYAVKRSKDDGSVIVVHIDGTFVELSEDDELDLVLREYTEIKLV